MGIVRGARRDGLGPKVFCSKMADQVWFWAQTRGVKYIVVRFAWDYQLIATITALFVSYYLIFQRPTQNEPVRFAWDCRFIDTPTLIALFVSYYLIFQRSRKTNQFVLREIVNSLLANYVIRYFNDPAQNEPLRFARYIMKPVVYLQLAVFFIPNM